MDRHCDDTTIENFGVWYYIHSVKSVLLLSQEKLATVEHFDVDCKSAMLEQVLEESS